MILKREHARRLFGLAAMALALQAGLFTVDAAPVTKLATGTNLLDGASWNGSVTPTSTDVATWDGTSLGAGLSLGANTNWLGVSVSGALTDISVTGAGVLTVGSSGFDLSTSANNMTLANAINLGTNQSWSVNSGQTLQVGSIANSPFNLSKTGSGNLQLTGNSTLGGVLDIQTGTVLMAGDLTVAGLTGTGTLETSGTGVNKWFTVNAPSDSTFSGSLINYPGTTGRGMGLTKTGTGALTLNGVCTINDSINVNGGTLNLVGTGVAITNYNHSANVLSVASAGSARAVLNLSGGATLLANYNPANTYNTSAQIGSGASSVGSMSLSSGRFNAAKQLNIGSGTTSYGTFNQSGGTSTIGGFLALCVGGTSSRAVFDQSGGSFTMSAAPATIGANSTGIGVVNLSGTAAFTNTATGDNGLWFGENGTGILNLSGSATLFMASGNNGIQLGRGATGSGTANLNGGTLIAKAVYKGSGTGTLNFNGGTLKANVANMSFLTGLTAAYVYSGGATIDDGGFAVTVGQQLLAPSGDGVASISVTAGGSGYLGAPVVTITGDGSGATAVATVSGGAVTGITITSPGVNYTTATAALSGGGGTGATLGTPTLAANTSGGLTKTGNGTLTLSGGYSYNGPTLVTGGTLSLDAAVTTPSPAGDLTVNGATLTLSLNNGANSIPAANVSFGSTLNLNFGTLSGTPVAAIAATGSLSATALTTINVSGIGFTGGMVVPLITTTAAASTNNFVLGPLPPGVFGVLTNNTANSLDFLVTSAAQLLTWYGADDQNNPLTTWDINTSTNWNTGTLKYLEYGSYGDIVTFDDNAFDPNVTLNTTVIPALVTVNNSSLAYTISGSGGIGGATSLTKDGTGTLALNTANTYTGGTIINAGLLAITNNNALGAPAGAVSLGGATLQANASLTSARPLTLTGAATIGVASGATAQWNGAISGTSSLSKTDDGTLTLTAANNLTGNIWVKGGTLTIDSGGSISNATWNSVGMAGSDIGVVTLKGTGSFITTFEFNIGDIDSTTGTLNIQDSATLTANSLFVSSANSANSTAVGTVNQTGGTVTQVSTAIGAFAIGGRRSVENEPGAFGVYNLSGGTVIANSGIRVGGNGTGTINQSGGLIQARGGINVARIVGSTGTNNLNGGTLETFNVASSTGSNAFFNFNGGTLKAYTNNTAFFTGLTRANVRDNGGVIDTAGFNITIAQALMASDMDGDAGTGGITKIGNGTLTLTGTNNYAGPTRLGAGKLIVNPAHQVTGPLTVSNATTFAVTLPTTNGAANIGALTLGSGATTLEFNYGTNLNSSAPILVAGALTNSGTCTIRITGTFAVGVIPLVDYTGTIQGGGTFTSQLLAPVGVVATYSNSVANSMIYAVISQVGAGLVWTGTDAINPNVWDISISTNWIFGANPIVYNDGDPVSFNDVGSGTVNLSNTVSPVSVLISNTADYSFSGPGSISGTTGIRKQGSGNATLNFTANNYTGSTVVSNGSLTIAGGGAIGDASAVTLADVAGVSLTVANGETVGSLAGGGTTGGSVILQSGELIVGGNNATTAFDGNLSGSGSFRKRGAGTMSLGGAYSASSGDVTVDNGALNLTGSGSLSSIRLLIGTGGTTGTVAMNTGNTLTNNFSSPGTWWYDYALGLGVDNNGNGTLNMSGGTLNVTGNVWVSGWGGTGHWNQTGGTANVSGNYWVGMYQDNNTSQPNGSIGTAIISNATLSAGNVAVGRGNVAGSRVKGDMTVASGGVVTSENDMHVGYAGQGSTGWGSYGTLNIENGGIVNVASTIERWMLVGRYDSIDATVNVKSGGTLNLNAGTDLQINEGNNSGTRVVNVEGLLQGTAAGGSYIDLNRNASTVGTTTLNITNGGVVAVDAIIGKANCTLNFDNGTLKATANDANYIGDGFTVNILSGGAILDTDGHNPTVRGNLLNNGVDEDGGLTKNGAGALYLNGANTYTNVTTVNAGTLGGSGTIAGPVDVTAGGTLAPGDASIGTLTLNGALTLAGNVAVEVNTSVSPSNDLCVVTGTPTYTGSGKTVIVSNQGPALVVGDTFQLFSQAVVNGGALNVTGGGAVWTNRLALDGTISVVALAPTVPTTPTNLAFNLVGGNLTLSWPSSYAGWTLQTQTNSRSVGLTVPTNTWFDIPGSAALTTTNFAVNPTNPTVFFRLRLFIP